MSIRVSIHKTERQERTTTVWIVPHGDQPPLACHGELARRKGFPPDQNLRRTFPGKDPDHRPKIEINHHSTSIHVVPFQGAKNVPYLY